MKKYPIYVLGHKNPDSDSIVSAIAYADLLNKQGKNAIAARGFAGKTAGPLLR